MTNEQFKLYLAKRLAQAQERLTQAKRGGDKKEIQQAQADLDLVNDFAKISRGAGANLRRVRRDYERRLARQGKTLTL
jgi:hypothetical protein